MRTRIGALAALGMLLTGCGGNGNPNTNQRTTGAPNYTITDLGALNYYGYYYGNFYYGSYYPIYGLSQGGLVSVNNQLQVISNTATTASVWQNGVLTQLNTGYSTAAALNSNGKIVGEASTSTGNYEATVWKNGQQSALGALPGGNYSDALGVNATGDVVGESYVEVNNNYFWHAFLWQTGTLTDLGTLPNGSYSLATAVNATDQVVGWSNVSSTDYTTHAFSWQNGQMHDLGFLSGGTTSEANAINDAGQIVSCSDTAAQGLFDFRPLRAVVWSTTGMIDLGTLGGPGAIAFDINNQAQIVGTADTSVIDNDTPPFDNIGGTGGTGSGSSGTGSLPSGVSPGSGNPIGGGAARSVKARSAGGKTRGIGDTYVAHAFLYSGATMVDLNTDIPANSGWELIQATGINDQGAIAGFGTLNKRVHAYQLLTFA